MEKLDIYKGLKCCSEFLCGECPYQIYDSDHYKLRCIHKLIVDLNSLLNGGKKKMRFHEAAICCEELYGIAVNLEEEWFFCCECDEPIYADDWGDIDYSVCPICGKDFSEDL